MFKHHPPNDEDHLENQSTDVPRRCMTLEAKEAEDKHLLLMHSINHVNLIKNISSKQFNSKRHEIASKLGSIYFNEGSSQAVYLATDSIVEVVKRVVSRELDSVVAIVRPSAIGDPLGEYRVTPFGYYVQLEKLMNFAEGRVVLILEGGSNLDFISKSMYDYLEVLLVEKPVIESAKAYSFESTWGVIQEACQE
ncbi:hypothetical protein JHK87_044470 [Glycine soja]|nr:hypothetical protein JHK87_044470 [Glycine soja]